MQWCGHRQSENIGIIRQRQAAAVAHVDDADAARSCEKWVRLPLLPPSGVQMTTKQRMAVVTGAGSGLGQAIGLELAADGFAVATIDLDEASARETARQIEKAGGRAVGYKADVSRSAELDNAATDGERSLKTTSARRSWVQAQPTASSPARPSSGSSPRPGSCRTPPACWLLPPAPCRQSACAGRRCRAPWRFPRSAA